MHGSGATAGAAAAPPRARPATVLRALPCGMAHSSLTAAEKTARTLPVFTAGNLRLAEGPRRPGRDPACLRSQPQLPWSLGGMLEGHCASCSESQDTACLPHWLSRPPLVQGRGGGVDGPAFSKMLSGSRAGSGLPVPTCFTVFMDCQPLKELCVCCSNVPPHRAVAHQSRTVTVLCRKGWD